MKPASWIFSALLVTVLGALWLRGLEDAPYDELPGPTLPQSGNDAPAPVQTGDRVAVGPQASARPALAPHLVLAHELWAVLGSGQDGHARRERQLLIELVAEGSDPALGVVVDALEDPRCIHHGDGSEVRTLFQPLDPSPAVFALARRTVESMTTSGHPVQKASLVPWFRLAARHDVTRGTRLVLEHLLSEDPAVSGAAATVATSLLLPEQRELVLIAFLTDELGLDQVTMRNLAQGLVSNTALRDQLFGVALGQVTGGPLALALFDGSNNDARRGMLIEFLGRHLDASRLDDVLHLYRTTDSSVLRASVVGALRRTNHANCPLDPNSIELGIGPFVLDLIANGDEPEAIHGATLLRELEGLHGLPNARATIEDRLAGGTTGNLAGILNSALAKLPD